VLQADDEEVTAETLKKLDEGKLKPEEDGEDEESTESDEDENASGDKTTKTTKPRQKKAVDQSASSIADRVRQQLKKKRSRQKASSRNDYKNRYERIRQGPCTVSTI